MKTPILKWAGGKTQILDQITAHMPQEYDRYFEPFIGGGAVLLAVSPKVAVINDINTQLINLYKQIKSNAKTVISLVNELDNNVCDKDFYYAVRTRYNEKISNDVLDAECAALLIWINKHCFNGLYRVNGKGLFNVPYNNKINGESIDKDNIAAISEYFNCADIQIFCEDFEAVCENVHAGDFVYFDSPYIPVSDTANFTDYSKAGFSLSDHERLAELFKRLDSIGAKLLLSNNDVPIVHSLYKGYDIHSFTVKRMINRDAAKRTGIEVLIKNY